MQLFFLIPWFEKLWNLKRFWPQVFPMSATWFVTNINYQIFDHLCARSHSQGFAYAKKLPSTDILKRRKLCNHQRHLKKLTVKPRLEANHSDSRTCLIQCVASVEEHHPLDTHVCLCIESSSQAHCPMTPRTPHPTAVIYYAKFCAVGQEVQTLISSLCTYKHPILSPIKPTLLSPSLPLLPDSSTYFLYFVYSPGRFILLSKIYLIILVFYWHLIFLKNSKI